MDLILYNKPLCHSLSNALEMSRKRPPLTFNPNKAQTFESRFFLGLNLNPPPSHFKNNQSNINIILYNC